MPWSGIAPGLPTDLKPTLRLALIQFATPTDVGGLGGEDAVELDTSKMLLMLCLCDKCNTDMAVALNLWSIFDHLSSSVHKGWLLNHKSHGYHAVIRLHSLSANNYLPVIL